MGRLNINCNFSYYRRHVGLPFPEIIRRLGLAHSFYSIEELYFGFARNNIDLIRLNNSASDVLEQCREKGVTVSLITSKPSNPTKEILDFFEIKIDTVICGDQLAFGKPNGLIFKHLMNEINLAADEIIYVGDTLIDLQFAVNGGIRYFHFEGGFYGKINPLLRNRLSSIDRLSVLIDHL